jgi:diguanylate cyclase (GGDEF)-like protein
MSVAAYSERVRRAPMVGGLPEAARSLLYGTIAAAVLTAAATSLAPESDVRWGAFVAVLAGGAFAQFFATHVPGNQVFHTGLAFTLAAALLLPPELVVVVCVVQHVPEWLRQRYPWFIQSFNIANAVLSGLAAWSVQAAVARNGAHVGASAGTAAVVVACAAATTYVLVNHALLARMLRVARGYDLSASGLFSLDGLITDFVVAAVGVGIAFALLHSWALAPVVALPLVLIQRALALPTLREQALTDHKTGLLNSRGIDQRARSEFARARRLGLSMSVLLCDLDDLRQINNRFGHLDGDAALTTVAAAFRNELRQYDLCARFGGDEFLVVLPETTEAEALAIAQRIQEWLEGHPIQTGEGRFAVAVSIGTASLGPEETQIGEMIARADTAMYGEKRSGRRSFLTVG